MTDVLFILKLRKEYGPDDYNQPYHILSSGLYNSARMVVDMLNDSGVAAKLVQVVDANDIDREVYIHRPKTVIIEAVWAPPNKLKELIYLHRGVNWIVRVHSEFPFLSQEGMALDWIFKYLFLDRVHVAFNSKRIYDDMVKLAEKSTLGHKVLYLPNYFPVAGEKHTKKCGDVLDIGCFGAIRPMKNQLAQAVAAIRYADKTHKSLRFHVNRSFHGGVGGDGILKNLRAILTHTGHELVEHCWQSAEAFTELVKQMDLGMQVSFTESFNIVSADFVNAGVPVVVSPEVSWVSSLVQADPTSTDDMVKKMGRALGFNGRYIQESNLSNLKGFSKKSKKIWLSQL